MRFVRLAALLMLLGVAGIGSARWVGSSTLPEMAAFFTLPDGRPCPRPCLFGISPGITSAADASALLMAHPLTQALTVVNYKPFRLEGKATHIVMVSFNAMPSGLVDEVTLSVYVRYGNTPAPNAPRLPDSGTLGDMLALFGVPNFIQITNGGDPMLAFFGSSVSAGANAAPHSGYLASLIRNRVVNRHIVPRTPLSRLTLFRYEPCPDSAFIYVFPQWQGLAGFRRYARGKALETRVRRMDSQGATFAPCYDLRPAVGSAGRVQVN